MSELDDAIAKLEQAVARLEQASDSDKGGATEEPLMAVAAAIAARIDAALARLGQLLERED